MRDLNYFELSMVAGGEQEIDDSYGGGGDGGGGGGDDMQVVEIVGTKQMVQDAKDDYAFKNDVANGIGAVYGAAAGGVVMLGCDALTEGAAVKDCATLGGAVATYAGNSMVDHLKAMIR